MKDSHIQWTDHTFNPWEGCAKVSPGCLNCYAEARNLRWAGGKNWGKGAPRRRTSESNWNEPRRWNRESQSRFQAFNAEASGSFGHLSEMLDEPVRPRVFSASLADWLDDEVEISWLADFLVLVFDCGFLDWLLLSKRPENFALRLRTAASWIRNHKEPSERNAAIVGWIEAWLAGTPPENVWVGTTVEDQARADERLPLLLAIPAAIRFLSCEPLLGRVEFSDVSRRSDCVAQLGRPALAGVRWVIVGGESGPRARACDLGAVESIVRQCRNAGVAVFVKQLGAKPENDFAGYPGTGIDRRLPLEDRSGGNPEEWPERFRVREFPGGAS